MSEISNLLKSYRVSTHWKDIATILIKSSDNNDSIMWQTLDSHRTIFTVREIHYSAEKKEVRLAFASTADLIDPRIPIYVKLSFRETVFKGQILKLGKDEVTLHVPIEVQIREFREVSRHSFKAGEQSVSMKAPNSKVSLKLDIKDISARGLGIIVSENNSHFFQKGRTLTLEALGDTVVPHPLSSQVVYVQKKRTRSEKGQETHYQVGIKMIDQIPLTLLDAFTKLTSSKRNHLEELLQSNVISPEFHEEIKKNVDTTLKSLKQKPAIAKYLNQLEITRDQDDYLVEHIKVLTLVCTFCARSLNWVSDASTEKFVYAAYLHDAPLFQFPRLAQLKNKKDFELMKDQLLPEEQELFWKHPELAAKIAEEDPSAPPDVTQMLMQQRELPDQSGYPRGVSVSKITPMSALFILAHDLTDEIVKNPNWSFPLWFKAAKNTYRGSHFNKVLEGMETLKVTMKR
jgi:hypothetical protein